MAPPADEWIITGQVLDAVASGIAGASVQVEAGGDEKTEGRIVGRATSEAMGDFRIRLPGKPEGELFIRVKKERFAPFHAPVRFESGEQETFVDVELGGTMSVRGQVLEAATSRPVRGADVTIEIVDRRWAAITDDHGRFELQGLPGGSGLLIISRPGFGRDRQPVRVEGDPPEARILLQPDRPLRLHLVNDRKESLAGADVEVQAGEDTFAAMTDDDGRAEIRGIRRDITEVQWRADHPDAVRMAGFTQTLDLGEPPGVTSSRPATSRPDAYTIILPRGGKVAGTVTDATDGEPVSSARIMVIAGPGGETALEWTDIEGRFEVPGVMPGPILVAIQQTDYAPELVEDEARAGWTRQIPIRLSKGKPLAGVVVDEAGRGLDQVQVVCTRWRNRGVIGLRALTNEQGRFEFEHAPDGPIEFALHRPGGGRLQGQTLTAGKTDYRFTLPAEVKPPPRSGDDQDPSRSGALEVGKPAPEFAVTALDGTSYRLSKLRGKYIFVDVWATWCPPCRAEIPTLKRLHEQVKARSDFVMLGISLDDAAEPVEAFAEKEELSWPLAAGPDSGADTVAERFGVKFVPFNVLIGPNGTVLAVEIHGPDLPRQIRDLAPPPKAPPQ